MDKEPNNHVAEGAQTGPPTPVRRQWPLAVAVLALAAALVSLTTLRGADSSADTAAPAALSNPLAAPLADALPAQRAAQGTTLGAPVNYSAGSSAKPSKIAVEIMDYKYTPATLKVKVGDTVTWTNHDSAPHDVAVTDGPEKFKSPTLKKGESFTYTFAKSGKYSYYCSIHPDMKASVTAEGSGTPPPSTPPPTDPPTDPHEPPPGPPSDCTSSAVADAFLAHVKGAHLERSLTGQVEDLLALDQWVLTHTVWIESFLTPALDGDAAGKELLTRLWAHIDGAHLQVSPLDQVADILAFDQWVKTHTVWISSVLEPLLEQATCE